MNGSSCIWIHGWGMSPAVWGDPRDLLPDAKHRMFSYADCDSVEQMRERLRRMICAETAPICLIGWSLGGMLALEALLEQWERGTRGEPAAGRTETVGCAETAEESGRNAGIIQSGVSDSPWSADGCPPSIVQVLPIGATLRFAGPDRAKSWPERVVRRMRSQLGAQREETLLRFAESMFSPGERGGGPEYRHRLERLRLATDFSPQALDDGLRYLLETDLNERWSRYTANGPGEGILPAAPRPRPEVVWLHGTDDPICPVDAIADIPDTQKVLFHGAGHVPFMTEPDLFAEAVRRIIYEYR